MKKHDDHDHSQSHEAHARYRSVLDAPPRTWITLGPSSVKFTNAGAATGPCGGRVNWLEFTPPTWSTHRYLYAAAVGGVWRSPNDYASYPFWQPLTDDLSNVAVSDRPGLQHVGCIALDRFNEGVIYAGTGDKTTFPSAGILKSTDADVHWTLVGKNEFAGGSGITRMFVDPTDPTGKTVFAVGGRSNGRGIFMSTDFGATWQLRHGFPNDIVTPTQDLVDAQDLVWQIDAGGNLILTCAIVVSQPQNPLASLGSGFYRSSDKGATWAPMVWQHIYNAADGSDADPTWVGPTTMATAGIYDGDPIYAAVTGAFQIDPMTPREILNIFKYEADSPIGPAWRSLFKQRPMITQDGYDQPIATARRGSTIYFGWRAQVVIQSWNGGTDWADLGYENPPHGKQAVHSDHHCLLYATEEGGERVYSANDGGIFRFEYAADAWWSVSTFSLKNMLNNSATANPRDPRIILADGQDCGMNVLDPVADRWGWPADYNGTGDEFGRLRFAPDPVNDPEMVFWARSEGGLFRSDDRGQHFKSITPSGASSPSGTFIVFAFHPVQRGRIVGAWPTPQETRDYGETWTPIAQPGQLPGLATAIAYADPDTIYAAFGPTLFWRSNASNNWSQLTSKNFNGNISSIVVDKLAPIAVFLCTDRGSVWQTLDGGVSWKDITGNLAAGPATSIALVTEPGKWTLFGGTGVGVWMNEMPNGVPGTWVRFGTGLPDIDVMDVELNPFGRILTVATMGRGTWQATF